MSYYLRHEDFTQKIGYKRISEFKEGLVKMEQNGFIYLIIQDNNKQWETAVNLSCGTIETRDEIEREYDRIKLGFVKVNGIVTLQQVPDLYIGIEKILIAEVGQDKADKIIHEITYAGLLP